MSFSHLQADEKKNHVEDEDNLIEITPFKAQNINWKHSIDQIPE